MRDAPRYRKPVFVLDDDPSIQISLRRLLSTIGLESELFESLEDFLDRAEPSRARCLLLDIHLNGRSGIDLKRQLNADGTSLPVIFMTGDESEAIRKSAMEVGCVAYLIKPFTTKSLVEAVDKASNKSPQQVFRPS